MPNYDFVCKVCGARFDQHIPFYGEQIQLACPHGHTRVRRVYRSPSVVFKGGGWYVNDSRSEATKAEAAPTRA